MGHLIKESLAPPCCRIDGGLSRQLEQAPFSEDSARPTTKVSDSWELRW